MCHSAPPRTLNRARSRGTPTCQTRSTPGTLDETARLVTEAGGGIVAVAADVRDLAGLQKAVEVGVEKFGRLDSVVANAGIVNYGSALELGAQAWLDMMDVNLTGVWWTIKAALPYIVAGGRGGSIVMTSSVAGLRGIPNSAHYVTAKTGLVGLMRALAVELGPHDIRVNTVHQRQHADAAERCFVWLVPARPGQPDLRGFRPHQSDHQCSADADADADAVGGGV
jgi:NAD(P)-dependent dehydrogenase (short-subunit alcohol dehydrogenase family)